MESLIEERKKKSSGQSVVGAQVVDDEALVSELFSLFRY